MEKVVWVHFVKVQSSILKLLQFLSLDQGCCSCQGDTGLPLLCLRANRAFLFNNAHDVHPGVKQKSSPLVSLDEIPHKLVSQHDQDPMYFWNAYRAIWKEHKFALIGSWPWGGQGRWGGRERARDTPQGGRCTEDASELRLVLHVSDTCSFFSRFASSSENWMNARLIFQGKRSWVENISSTDNSKEVQLLKKHVKCL